jgi:hypothetical protein
MVNETYIGRLLDARIGALFAQLPATLPTGPRACGKTTTAARHAATTVRLDESRLKPGILTWAACLRPSSTSRNPQKCRRKHAACGRHRGLDAVAIPPAPRKRQVVDGLISQRRHIDPPPTMVWYANPLGALDKQMLDGLNVALMDAVGTPEPCAGHGSRDMRGPCIRWDRLMGQYPYILRRRNTVHRPEPTPLSDDIRKDGRRYVVVHAAPGHLDRKQRPNRPSDHDPRGVAPVLGRRAPIVDWADLGANQCREPVKQRGRHRFAFQ